MDTYEKIRRPSIEVQAGSVVIGGRQPVSIQSMCNTDTCNIAQSIAQCTALARAGASLIRLSTQGLREVRALADIKAALRSRGIETPLVADVHFSSSVALAAARIADKVRINPGNFARNPAKMQFAMRQLIDTCKQYHTALRIGVNHGSLSGYIIEKYGNTPQGMARAAMQYLALCRQYDFDGVVVSLKSSNSRVMVEANRLLVAYMDKEDMHYPVHLGVTEAGNGREARMKAAAAIALLMKEGIGDTLRISLTEDPVQEIVFGTRLRDFFIEAMKNRRPGTTAYSTADADELIIQTAWDWGDILLDKGKRALDLHATIAGKVMDQNYMDDFCLDLLQATRCHFSKPEYISCPGCGRTQYNIEETLAQVKRATAHLKGCTIAVMGCIVNGPGEMADADFGYVGEGFGRVSIYKKGQRVRQGVPESMALTALLEIIENSKN